MTGPFDSEQQARQLPAVRQVYAAFDADPGAGKMAPHNLRMLLDALAGAGVYLGAYDHRIVQWMATWEPQTVAVVCGWVQRAGQAGQLPAWTREGPPGAAAARPPGEPGDRATATHADPPPAQGGEVMHSSIGRAVDSGQAPRESPARPGSAYCTRHGPERQEAR